MGEFKIKYAGTTYTVNEDLEKGEVGIFCHNEAEADEVLRQMQKEFGCLYHAYGNSMPTILAEKSNGKRWIIYSHNSDCGCYKAD